MYNHYFRWVWCKYCLSDNLLILIKLTILSNTENGKRLQYLSTEYMYINFGEILNDFVESYSWSIIEVNLEFPR